MKDEVLSESAPLHGRSDLELKIRPFNYLETAEFLDGYTNEEKAVCYGLTNGVAKYIEQFDTRLTLEENITSQFYSTGGYFSRQKREGLQIDWHRRNVQVRKNNGKQKN